VITDHLILVGGVNVNHSVPGVAFIHLENQKAKEFEIPVCTLYHYVTMLIVM
jgi:hypothetical protein